MTDTRAIRIPPVVYTISQSSATISRVLRPGVRGGRKENMWRSCSAALSNSVRWTRRGDGEDAYRYPAHKRREHPVSRALPLVFCYNNYSIWSSLLVESKCLQWLGRGRHTGRLSHERAAPVVMTLSGIWILFHLEGRLAAFALYSFADAVGPGATGTVGDGRHVAPL